MSAISNFRNTLRQLGIIATLASSAISPAQIPAKRPDSEEDSKTTRPFNKDGIIGSEDWKFQGEWSALSSMDEHMHRYGRLEEMVSMDVDDNKLFWYELKWFREGKSIIAIKGRRSDGKEFIARRTIVENERKEFDLLCDDLNSNLVSEVAESGETNQINV